MEQSTLFDQMCFNCSSRLVCNCISDPHTHPAVIWHPCLFDAPCVCLEHIFLQRANLPAIVLIKPNFLRSTSMLDRTNYTKWLERDGLASTAFLKPFELTQLQRYSESDYEVMVWKRARKEEEGKKRGKKSSNYQYLNIDVRRSLKLVTRESSGKETLADATLDWGIGSKPAMALSYG